MNSQMHQILLKRVIGFASVLATGVAIALPVAATNYPKPVRQAEAKPILEGPVPGQISSSPAGAATGTSATTPAPAATTPAPRTPTVTTPTVTTPTVTTPTVTTPTVTTPAVTTPAVTAPATGTAETVTPAVPTMPSVIHQLPTRSTGTSTTPRSTGATTTPSSTGTTGTTTGTTPAQAPSRTTPATQTPTSPSTSTTPATTQANNNTIVQVAASNEKFKTLVSALTEAELTQVLQGAGPFTVFAPTDDAFAELPAGTLEELLKPENRSTLIKVLTYHVVPGKLTAEQLSAGQVQTVEGSPLTVAIKDGKVTVNTANVIQTDIMASNGVIHVIDKVILPQGI